MKKLAVRHEALVDEERETETLLKCAQRLQEAEHRFLPLFEVLKQKVNVIGEKVAAGIADKGKTNLPNEGL